MRTGYEHGYRVITLTDCTAAISAEEHRNAIAFNYPMFSHPVSSTEVLDASQSSPAERNTRRGRLPRRPSVDADHRRKALI